MTNDWYTFGKGIIMIGMLRVTYALVHYKQYFFIIMYWYLKVKTIVKNEQGEKNPIVH